MAFDGITACAVVSELADKLSGGSISKIAQPEKDELLLTCKNAGSTYRLTLSANPSTPLAYLRDDNIISPVTAPLFCMSLRKHIGGGRIRRIYQPGGDLDHEGLERIIVFVIEHRDEMGEPGTRYLVTELMGKHSNIILLDGTYKIIDSIKHISHMTSSVREVLPGRDYFIAGQSSKADLAGICLDKSRFMHIFSDPSDGMSIYRKIYMSVTGISPSVSAELLYRAGIDADRNTGDLGTYELDALYGEFCRLSDIVAGRAFEPNIIYDNEKPAELSAIRLKSLEGGDMKASFYTSISEAVRVFYREKERQDRIKSKSEDIRAILKKLTERSAKKLDILEKQYADTEKKDKYRLYGELINTYGYGLSGGEKYLECENYYDGGRLIRVPLDERLTPQENSVKYFGKYQKLKRARDALKIQLKECRDMLYHLGSISEALMLCESEADISEIRREMSESGYIRHTGSGKRMRREEQKSKPLHFVSSDGIDIYVGRNNYQNEELDFKIAGPDDWWFHAKNIPGSHVIAKTGGTELPDSTCLEAAALAAYYSRAVSAGGTDAVKVEVDYVRRRELKKVPGAAPGFVIYHTNYSLMIEPRDKI